MDRTAKLEARIEQLEWRADRAETAVMQLCAVNAFHTTALALALKKIFLLGELRDDDISEWKRILEDNAEEYVDTYDDGDDDIAKALNTELDEAIRVLFLRIDRFT